MSQLLRRGVAAIQICSRPFETLARGQMRSLGCPQLPLVLIDHPLGGIDLPAVQARAGQAAPQLLDHLRRIAA